MSKNLKQLVREAVTEFFDRETMDSLKSQGITDPSDQYTVNHDEVKQKCQEFLAKVNAFKQEMAQFDMYINNVPDDDDGDNTLPLGARMSIRHRNMFGARDLDDEYLEQDLDNIDSELHQLDMALIGVTDAIEAML